MGFYSFSKLEHSTRPRIALRRIWQKEEALEKLSQILHIGIIEILIKEVQVITFLQMTIQHMAVMMNSY